jgi:hypothetical protein
MGCTTVQERYTPYPMAANATLKYPNQSIGGFLTEVDGSITIQGYNDQGTLVTLVSAFPLTAGIYSPIPIYLGVHGGVITLAGGAKGTLVG